MFVENFKVIFNNYYIFLFIIPFFLGCFLSFRKHYNTIFSIGEKTVYNVISLFLNLIWSNAVVVVITKLGLSSYKKMICVCVFMIASAIISMVYSGCYLKVKNTVCKILSSEHIKDNYFGIAAFLLMAIKLFFETSNKIEAWHAWCYATDYSFGFSSRFLAGQIMSLFNKGKVTLNDIFVFCFITGILLVIIVSVLMNKAVRRADESYKTSVKFICICFICCPGNIQTLFSAGNLGKLEVFGLIASLVGVLLFNKINNLPIKYLSVTLMGIIGLMFYQGYAFLYYSIIVIAMLFDIIDENEIKIKNMVYGIVSVGINAVSFLYFQLFSHPRFDNIEDFISEIAKKTDMEINYKAINYEYFSSLKDAYDLVSFYIDNHIRIKLLIQLVLMVPVIILFTYIALRHYEKVKINKVNTVYKVRLLLCILSICAVLPQFLLNVDWGRWLTAIVIDSFFLILYYVYKKDTAMIEIFENMSSKIKKNPALALVFIVVLTFVGAINATDFSGEAYKLFGIISPFLP